MKLEPRCEFCGDTGLRSFHATRVSSSCNRCTPEDRLRREKERTAVLEKAIKEFRRKNPGWMPFGL